MFSTRLVSLVAASAIIAGVAAQTSLYIPGFDPQPISANVLGVGSDGRTTWQIAAGTPSGSLSDIGIIGTATLIAGPNDAQVVMSNEDFYASEACTINNGLADCTVVAAAHGEPTSTDTLQETASPFPVQVGPAATPSPGGGSTPPASTPPTDTSHTSKNITPGAQTPSPNVPTSSNKPAVPTNQPNGALAFIASTVFSGVAVVAAAVCML